MRLLINTSTLKGTGVTQVAVSFICECRKFEENEYLVLMSKSVAEGLKKEVFSNRFYFIRCDNLIFFSVFFIRTINKLNKIEERFKPDCVFSIFGPSYWRPKAPHLMGYAYPHYIYKDSPFFKKINTFQSFSIWIKEKFHKWHLNRNGDFYVCETRDVANRIRSLLNVSLERIFVVNNTCNHFFLDWKPSDEFKSILPQKDTLEFRLLCLCSPYPHKNLQILNEVIPLLRECKLNKSIKFVVTLQDEDYNKLFCKEVRASIINVGILPLDKCPTIYSECDALFQPTLLECFSAAYVEAMYMGKPIVTSDLSFAHAICKEAASFFAPDDLFDVRDRIVELVSDRDLYDELAQRGKSRYTDFPSPEERAKAYLAICKKISN